MCVCQWVCFLQVCKPILLKGVLFFSGNIRLGCHSLGAWNVFCFLGKRNNFRFLLSVVITFKECTSNLCPSTDHFLGISTKKISWLKGVRFSPNTGESLAALAIRTQHAAGNVPPLCEWLFSFLSFHRSGIRPSLTIISPSRRVAGWPRECMTYHSFTVIGMAVILGILE